MNKVLVVFLAVCIFNIHAFVKRDTEPIKDENYLEKIKSQIQDISKTIGHKVSDTFNPDQLQKSLKGVLDNISNVLDFNKKIENQEQRKED